jgi:hypothetical protein
MPGLLRGMARTAAVVGTATATRNAVNRRQAEKNAQAYSSAVNSVQPQQAPPQRSTTRLRRRNCTLRRHQRYKQTRKM